MSTRRDALARVKRKPSTHPGLWLDKYLPDNDPNKPNTKSEHILDVTGCHVADGYAEAFDRWLESFPRQGTTAFDVQAPGRLVIGLGAKNVLEMGLRLDRTWGLPLLPGSALKGLASRTAHLRAEGDGWSRPTDPSGADAGEHHAFLFGTTEASGAVLFHDAWWIPGSVPGNVDDHGERVPIDLDVMTVHHPDYYQSPKAPTAPSDFDSPNPVSFATVRGSFAIVLQAARPDVDDSWLDAARTLLLEGLETLGLGAKTNAGYGRLAHVDDRWQTATGEARAAERAAAREAEEAEQRDAEEAKARAEEQAEKLAQMNTAVSNLQVNNAGDSIPRLLELYGAISPDAVREFANLAIDRLNQLNPKFLKKKADKSYVKALFAAAGRTL